ncbi:MAG TPA: hypothetical protein PK708_08365 [Candidatus Competibacter sp.]|nr:hypothetical protein [Candidatus Competibacter sp.]
MKTIKRLLLGAAMAATMIVPSYNANAWDGGGGGPPGAGGHWVGGGGPPGRGGPPAYHRNGAGAAIAGLALGAIVGTAIANAAAPPPPVVMTPPPPQRDGCSSIMVQGVPYYNCSGRDYRYYRDDRDYYDDGE